MTIARRAAAARFEAPQDQDEKAASKKEEEASQVVREALPRVTD